MAFRYELLLTLCAIVNASVSPTIPSPETSTSILNNNDYSDITDPRIDRMYEEDLEMIWKNIANQDKIFEADPVQQKSDGNSKQTIDDEELSYKLINSSTTFHPSAGELLYSLRTNLHYTPGSAVGGSNIEMMTRIFHELFVHRRADEYDPELKAKSRDGIIERLSHYTLETQSQEFYARAPNGTVIKGVNIIGVIPGRNRGKPGDNIVLIGAHYLIPNELVNRRAKFAGAYILDMVMNYDPHPRSQVFPLDILAGVPESALWLRHNLNAGDFVSVWTRRVLDWPLWHQFQTAWDKLESNSVNDTAPAKLYMLDPPIPRSPLILSQLRFRAFFRSDHASFWTHRNRQYSDSLSAVLLTDMGPWRGKQRGCYHEFCDDARHLNPENMQFLKKVTDAVTAAVARIAE